MLFHLLMLLIAIATLIVTLHADSLSAKKKHSSYFQTVQNPTGKTEREALIPKFNKSDSFFAKLNSL